MMNNDLIKYIINCLSVCIIVGCLSQCVAKTDTKRIILEVKGECNNLVIDTTREIK